MAFEKQIAELMFTFIHFKQFIAWNESIYRNDLLDVGRPRAERFQARATLS